MTTRNHLWKAVLADLEDDTPRLVYADLLDEEGDSIDRDRAALIRCQYALARCGPPGA